MYFKMIKDYKNKKIKNLIKKWECPICHRKHDRGINASLNIIFEGLKIYMKEIKQEA